MEQTTRTHNLSKRLLSLLLAAVMCLSVMPMLGLKNEVEAATTPATITTTQALNRINVLIEKLNGKYFTTDGYSDSSPDDYRCKNSNVIQADWFKNLVLVPDVADYMPYQWAEWGYANIGWSCFGFACYAQWFIFAQKSSDNIVGTKIYEGPLNKTNIQSYAKTGDIIRFKGHSIIFISCDDNGITFLDNNWGNTNQIQYHSAGWNDYFSGEGYCYISGAANNSRFVSEEEQKNYNRFNQTAAIVDFYYKLAPGKSSAVVRSSPYNGGDSNKVGTLTSGEIHVTKSGWNTENHVWYYIGSGQFAGCYIYSENVTKCSHTHDKGHFEYYWKDHPHYNCYKCSVCGEIWASKETNYVASCNTCNPICSHSWNKSETVKQPSCTAGGTIKLTCDKCGATKTESLSPLGHNYGSWSASSDTHRRVCSRCGNAESASHSFGSWTAYSAEHRRVCSVCGGAQTYVHDWDNGTVKKDATYDTTGVRTYTCATCKTTKEDTIPSRGTVTIHLDPNGGIGSMADVVVPYGESVTIPAGTFTRTDYEPERTDYQQVGWVLYRHFDKKYNYGGNGWVDSPRINPNIIFTEEFYEVPGEWNFKVNPSWYNNNATDVTNAEFTLYAVWDYQYYTLSVDVTVDGEKKEDGYDFATFDVSINGRRLSDDVKSYNRSNALGGFAYTVDDIKTSGCYTNTGKASYSGTITSDIHIDIPIITSHTWDKGKITKEPTCAATGGKTFICSVCGTSRTETIEKTSVHTWDDGYITKEPTCAAAGNKTFICSVCGTTRTETIEKTTSHKWDSGKVTKAATEKTEGIKTYTCSVCGEQKTEPIPPVAPVDPTDKPTVTVGAVTARAGEEIEIPVSIANNPGINTFSFGLDYDTARLQLKDVTIDPALGGQFTFKEKAVWLNATDTDYNGTILTLTFTVAADAQEGDIPIAVTYQPGEIANLKEEDVSFLLVPGEISVRAYQPGDINGDNKVNNKDLTRLMKYLAGDAVTVSADALDVNGDGKVNNKDLTRLMKYLAGDNVSIY